jgi:hypothetical protein
MLDINESAIENFAIELLQAQGYDYLFGGDIAPDGINPHKKYQSPSNRRTNRRCYKTDKPNPHIRPDSNQ